MKLVKTTKIASDSVTTSKTRDVPKAAAPWVTPPRARKATVASKQETLSERVAAATEELASGLAEAAAAAQELDTSMAQIASGAEQAAGASQQQLSAIKKVLATLLNSRREAEA